MPDFDLLLNITAYIFAVGMGLCIGSFANVLIYRIPRGIQFISGTSFCPSCGKRVMPFDLIPVLSFILLKGKCRHCEARISIRYPLIELLSGGLAAVAVWKYGYSPSAVLGFGIFSVLLIISVIDIEHMIIPDGLIVTLAVLAIAFTLLQAYGITEEIDVIHNLDIINRIIGIFTVSLPMFLLTLLIDNAFGGGDIKLSFVCGFLLGWKLMLLAWFLAVLSGGIHGILVKYIRKNRDTSHIPFGQYICVGVFVSILWGTAIIDGYLSIWGLK